MLGVALWPGARSYLRNPQHPQGLKRFLGHFTRDFRVAGDKGCGPAGSPGSKDPNRKSQAALTPGLHAGQCVRERSLCGGRSSCCFWHGGARPPRAGLHRKGRPLCS
eukprot:NODE_7722_length_424_cov_231.308943.p3 GENE.NODE_7722_length_424_cov_231.308943~~NODE_7722_length_424_cov_231.308943.p3  ORF type:complete len:120 (+),score=8.11 NODE_7722_length_424_cov_231.308943:42-362(+)